jgi:hypothetical protein
LYYQGARAGRGSRSHAGHLSTLPVPVGPTTELWQDRFAQNRFLHSEKLKSVNVNSSSLISWHQRDGQQESIIRNRAMEKQKTVEVYTISEEELFKSDKLLAFAESKLKMLQESISLAKSRRNERSLPAEAVRRVATSGLLSTKELSRLLLQTHKKSITSEFTHEFIWETIHRSHWRQLENFCELEPILEAKGHQWVFRKLIACEPERAAERGKFDEEWF